MAQPTIKDIAKALGITSAAVSKALSDKPDISAALKARVQAWVSANGYVPHVQARRLVTGTNRTLGVLLLGRFGRPVREYFGYHLLDGIQARCQQDDFDVLLLNETDSQGQSWDYSDLARRRGVAALIVFGIRADDEQGRQLLNSGIPVVAVDSPLGLQGVLVTSDQRAGIGAAVAHLIDLGHRTVGYVGLRGNGWVARERREGFRTALSARSGTQAVEREAVLSVDGGRAAARELLGGPERPSGIVCASDLQAYGVMLGLRERGLRVPEDCSVTGFDDLHASALLEPALTTVAQNPSQLGWTAADRAIAGLASPLVAATHTIPTELIVRSSTRRIS